MIGIISDTHDNVEDVKKAVELFRQRGADFVLHLGDVVAPFTITFFEGVKLKVIRGNCDGDIETMKKKLEAIGGEYLGEEAFMEIGGKKAAAIHGQNEKRLSELISSGEYDYVFHGHTHRERDEMVGKTRVVNPGAHYWGTGRTIVFFEPEKDLVEFISLKD